MSDMYLLDTNALLILMFGEVTSAELSKGTIDVLQNTDELFVSEISLWEIAIKVKIGKLVISQSVNQMANKCRENGIRFIPVTIDQFDKTLDLPLIADQRDPFDRLIVAVAKLNGLTVISTDEKMYVHRDDYGISVLS